MITRAGVQPSDHSVWLYRPTDPNGMVQIVAGGTGTAALGPPVVVKKNDVLPVGSWIVTPSTAQLIESDGTTVIGINNGNAYQLTLS